MGERTFDSKASNQRTAQTHQRSPGLSPGKPNSGRGVERSFPLVRLNSRNSGVTSTQTEWQPRSSAHVSQEPLRKKPVSGETEHGFKGPPRTLREGRGVMAGNLNDALRGATSVCVF